MKRSTSIISTPIIVGLALWAIAEVAVLWVVGRLIGAGPLLVVLVAEALLGAALVRRVGSRTWASLRDAGRDPGATRPALSDAALVMAAGLLLAVPGFLTDVVGLLILIPATRGVARRAAASIVGVMTKHYRDRGDLRRAGVDPSSVVEGSVAEPPAPRPPDGGVVKGEIVP